MTRRITIGGIIFHVEPVGYEILKAYLDAWKELNPQKKTQWEELVAEHLLQQLHGANSITTISHVEGIHAVLPEIPSRISHHTSNSTRNRYFSKTVFGLW
jgi:hypothetical protein